jgi:hypothetical protein
MIRDPEQFAIYDARVAVALNALQVINNVLEPHLFPVLPGQNKEIKTASARIRRYAAQHQWALLGDRELYPRYIEVASKAAADLGCPLYTAEMLLFAQAVELYKEAFPNDCL